MQIQSQFRRYKGDMQPRVAYASSFIIAEKYINNTIGLGIPSPLDKSPEFAEQLDTIITKLQDLKELNYDHETSFIALEDKINGTVKKVYPLPLIFSNKYMLTLITFRNSEMNDQRSFMR